MKVTLDVEVVVNGRRWYLYDVEYETPDGRFSTNIYALSDGHAAMRVQELRETAVLSGRILGVIPAP